MGNVHVRREKVILPTYLPFPPERNPMFFEKRVYQGSSGRVYPLPVTERVANHAKPHAWDAVFLENEYLCLMILPELGGRVHRAIDKTNGYDLIYYQPVIKPALVGLAGPWISGGIEFNWPQHHRPTTFMPVNVHIQEHPDGAVTVWLSEHDPMARMKGMHGVRLRPGSACLELEVRLYNRTQDVQTFLWWANAAVRVHEAYQSVFPPDVYWVYDHARRAVSSFPRCQGMYYGIDYRSRAQQGVPEEEVPRQYPPPHCAAGRRTARRSSTAILDYTPDDLTWYANIPVPTSYMCAHTEEDFFGGYDHRAQAGVIHVADHHIAPGKKQWTWGNHEFGYAWDRNLTDPDENGEFRPYIELMAGVYSDNQPDFAFLQPGETKSWIQRWYPIQRIGPPCAANQRAAVRLSTQKGKIEVGVALTERQEEVCILLESNGKPLATWRVSVAPGQPFLTSLEKPRGLSAAGLRLRVLDRDDKVLIACTTRTRTATARPKPAVEPAPPAEMRSADELYLTGLHLEQYRHATRAPEDYWSEALRRDPGDARCNLALGRSHLRAGRWEQAEQHLRAAVARLTALNANPYDGEAYYQLGLCLFHQAFAAAALPGRSLDREKLGQAAAALHKAAWNQAWIAPARHLLAEIACLEGRWEEALTCLQDSLKYNVENLRARDLKAVVLRKLDRAGEACELLKATLEIDPMDWWARHLLGLPMECDAQVRLDVAIDYIRCGCLDQAWDLLADVPCNGLLGAAPLIGYYRAWISHLRGCQEDVRTHWEAAEQAAPEYCFPSRLEEIAILQFALEGNPSGARAPYYLGNLFYDRRRHHEAIRLWERAVRLEPGNAVAWRNLGVARYNCLRRPESARRAYHRARRAAPHDARLLYETDQLAARMGVPPVQRLKNLKDNLPLVFERHDLSIELCSLLNQVGSPEESLEVLSQRTFQPWEGGEGKVLAEYERALLALGRRALLQGNAEEAVRRFRQALAPPQNLGEARHLLAGANDVHYWLGCALQQVGNPEEARRYWQRAARLKPGSELAYYAAMAMRRLGRKRQAEQILEELLRDARRLAAEPARIDYFATSLPNLLLFDDDLTALRKLHAKVLEAEALFGLGDLRGALRLLRAVLKQDPNHSRAAQRLDEFLFVNSWKPNARSRSK